MRRIIWTLGAVLATAGLAAAQENSPTSPGKDTGFTMTLGGQGTAAEAASADDTELTHWWRRRCGYYGGGFYGGYSSYYGGLGYGGWGGYGYGGWGGYGYGGWGGGYSSFNYYSYRPYYRPFVHHHHYYRPYYFPRAIPYVSYGHGYHRFIGGDADDRELPAITLGSSKKSTDPGQLFPSIVEEGTFRYDGGPASPVPLPKPDASTTRERTTPHATSLPVSLPKSKPAKYTFKAYGER